MFDNVSKCVTGGGSRLVKAKSSPNVSKVTLSFTRKQNQLNQTTSSAIAPNKSSRSTKPPTISKISIKTSNNVVNPPRRASTNLDSSKSRLVVPSKPLKRSPNEARPDAAKTISLAARNDKKKVCKSASSSSTCMILEDRALLKKGLTYMPEKRPAKPEALRKKNLLDRSVSLSSVSSDSQTNSSSSRWIPIFSEKRSAEKEKKTELSGKGLINRSTSLWNVRTPRVDNSQYGKPSGAPARLNSVFRPSKIPLPASRFTGLGRSLADLSQVDRAGETIGQTMISFELDLDASSNERIYENCRETLDRASKFNSLRSTSMSNLEERAARLMAQLENDLESKEIVSVDVVDVAPPCRTEIVYEDRETPRNDKNHISVDKCDFEDDKNNEASREKVKNKKTIISKDIISENINAKSEKDSQKEESVIKESKSNRIKICENPDEFTKELKRSKENPNSIQELRRNWEKQIEGITNQNIDAKTIHAANSGRITVNLSKATRIGNDVVDNAQETKRKQNVVGKRAKDIEHLVNFFNCKNIDAAKEPPREVLIKSRSVDVPIIDTPALKKNESKSGNEYSGYASDGNCSEDSGHMSNENEVEWKETMENQGQREMNEFKGQQYFSRIDRDDDNNGMKIFEPTIVHRLAEPEKKIIVNRNPLMSNDVSSTDNCRDDRCSENGRQVRVERLQSRTVVNLNTDSAQ